MNDPSIRNPSYQSLTDQQFFALDELCDRFERQLSSDSRPSIETCLTEAPDAARDELLAELLTIEIDFRFSRGEQASAGEYQIRFPNHAELIERAFDFARNSEAPTGPISRVDEMTATIALSDTEVSKVGTAPESRGVEETKSFAPQPFGRYTLLRLLGKGGMGSVYLAHDRELDRKVAIKFPEFDDRPAVADVAIERFRREARAMATVHHPNICPIFDVGQHDGRHYLTMAYIDGQTLADVAASLSQSESISVIVTTARALHAAHEAGVVHRDLKPSNIMIDKRGEPIVTDFGLASRAAVSESGLTQSGLIIGSPAYMAPEQVDAAHDKVGPRTDVYALGVILYQLLTGRRPFDGAGLSVLGKISAGIRPEPPSQIAAVSASLEAICLKAMAHRIEDRFQSAEELAASLDDWLRTPAPVPVEARLSRKKTVLIAGGIVMLAVGSLLMAAVFSRGREPRPTDLDLTATHSSLESQSSRSALASGSSGTESVKAKDVSEQKPSVSQEPALPAKKLHPLLDDSYEWTPPVDLGPGINGARLVDHASISSDGLLMVMSRIENQRSQLWWSVRESERDPFPAASPLPPEVNSDGSHQTPFLSRDGLSLWFASNRPGGAGGSDLYVSRRKSVKDPFERPVSLGPTINTADDETSPFVTSDELTLLFAAGGPRHIFQAKRKTKEDSFAPPVRLANINDMFWQEFPRLSQDGLTLVLVVSRGAGTGQRLAVASRPAVDADFGKPVDLGSVNRGMMSGPSLSGDETTLYFSTGTQTRGLWMSRRVKRPSQAKPAESAKSGSSPPLAIAPFNATQARQHQEAWAANLKLPVEFTNSIGMKFRLIPPGEFLMGSTPEEIEVALKVAEHRDWRAYIESEGPQHKVVLSKPIYLGVTEVTQSQYEQVMGINPSCFSATGRGKDEVANLETGNHPVDSVSWFDATDFCVKLSQQERFKPFYSRSDKAVTSLEGTGYRLPTEAEWEFVCRAGTETRHCLGEGDAKVGDYAWFSENSTRTTHPVCSKEANPWGLYDTHGNVWEWCEDRFRDYPSGSVTDPRSPLSGERILRGGSWKDTPVVCRSAYRCRFVPASAFSNCGFRVALTVDAVKELLAKTEANSPPPAVAPFDEAQARAHQEKWAMHLGVPVEYENSIGMKFQLIPPGEFLMGSTPGEIAAALKAADSRWREHIESEGPQHKVILTKPLYVGMTEVTQSQYQQVMGASPSHFSATGKGNAQVANLETGNHPAEMVSWNDAADFCAKLSQQEKRKPFYARSGESITMQAGTGYRLPTDAEWEYACRAGTTTRFWSGDQDQDLNSAGWQSVNAGNRTHAAGDSKPNPFGLADMHGNVWEWVQDGWDPAFYSLCQKNGAPDPFSPFPDHQSPRPIRGGDYHSAPFECRSVTRLRSWPNWQRDNIGFRVVLVIDDVKNLKGTTVTTPSAP